MKTKLALVTTLFVLTLALTSANAAPSAQQCAAFCAKVRCIGGHVCGLYTNASGQTVCGCHPR